MMENVMQWLAELSAFQASLMLAALAAGYGWGIVHFRSLRIVADLLVAGNMRAIALQIARLAVLLGLFLVMSQAGALVLISGAIGLILARARVLSKDVTMP
tara:strand:+ start:2198 stop:2500 length:303 start_codon:yes stop_codon:yes gene_type:complete